MRVREKLLSFLACVAMLATLLPAAAAQTGGEIAGAVTDPKGAAVVGATVNVLDPATSIAVNSATTDAQGKFRVTGLPAGTYIVVVQAEGFNESRRDALKVEDGKTAAADFKLSVALASTSVTVTSGGSVKPNTEPVYVQLRAQPKTAGPAYAVNNLVLKRDAATFTLRTGELYFMPPVEGRHVGAVFLGEGELAFAPTEPRERRSLKLFTGTETLTEPFTELVLRFSDETFDEVKASAAASAGGGSQAARAVELYRANHSLTRKQFKRNFDLRVLTDILSPSQRQGFFAAFINGRRHSKLVFQLDPLGAVMPFGPGGSGGSVALTPEQVALGSYAQDDWGVWASFHMLGEYQKRTADSKQNRRLSNILAHSIDATLRGTRLIATDVVTLRAHMTGTRVLPFDLYPGLRVTRVQDEQGQDLHFIQESQNDDADFAVVFPEGLRAAKTYKLTVQFEGEGALKDYGGGNFSLDTRTNWYPSQGDATFGDRATFDITFRHPKDVTFIGVGAPAGAETEEAGMKVAKWSSGQTELAVAGFNFGKFRKKELTDPESGYKIEFYANTSLPPDLKNRENSLRLAEQSLGGANVSGVENALGELSTDGGATTGAAEGTIADAQNAMRIYNAYFGKLPYTRVAISQQPYGFFGQAWPTLVYMPYGAFLPQSVRARLFGSKFGTNTFFEYVGPHEVAHQWWGHTLGWSSYRDQWMSEGFSEFATSVWVQKTLGVEKFNSFWENQRKEIVEATPAAKGHKPYELGPVTHGLRLFSGKTGSAYQLLVYPKGAYILHMLRMMMFDTQNRNQDEPFQKMMQDFVQTHYNKDVSTEDFKRVVEKHMTPQMDLDNNKRMDWFFNQWVYGTEVPAYRFEYQTNGNTLTARITQSGVSDNFRMLVPVWVDYGKGWTRLGAVTLVGNTSFDLGPVKLPQTPKKVAAAALHDVLATSIENVKK
jgi:hypothetical protein